MKRKAIPFGTTAAPWVVSHIHCFATPIPVEKKSFDMDKNKRTRPDYVVLEEEIEDNYQPTQEELTQYAEWLGMILPRDKDLLWIAHEGLTKPLAKEWKPCRTEDDEIYYFNFETGESRWDHPCDEVHRNLLRAELERLGRPLAKQQQIEPSSSSQCKSQDNTNDCQRKAMHEEKVGSKISASISQPSEMHPSRKDSRTHEQTHDANGSQKACVSEKSKCEEVKETYVAWKLKKGTDEVVGFTFSNKEEEDREMNFQRGQMMDNIKKKIEEETSVVLQQARQAMQERVNMVIKEEETRLLADKRVKMLDVVDKQMELEKETKVARRREKLKIDLDKEKGERDQMMKEERTKMFDKVAKQIQEERAAKVMQRWKVHCDQKFQTEVANKDVKAEETRHFKKCSKRKEEYHNDYGGEGLLCLKLDKHQEELDKKLGSLDSTSGRLQYLKDHMLHCDLCNSTVMEKRELVCTINEKLKLEELKLYDKLKKKMVIQVREVIDGLERCMFEEDHRMTKTKLRDRINQLFEEFILEIEILLLRERGSLLREKKKDMHRGLGSSIALDIPITASFEYNAAVKEQSSPDDEDNDDEIEYLWSSKDHSQSMQVDKIEKAANVLSKIYSGGSFGAMKNPYSSQSSILPPKWWRPQPEGETNMRAENIRSRSKSSASKVAIDRLELMDGTDSIDITPDLKILRRQIEETLKDLMEQFRMELRKDLFSLRENKEVGYLHLADQQKSAGVLYLPKDLLYSLEGWRSEFGKELRDQVQQYKDELENKFLILKCEMKEELKVLLTLKDVSEVRKELKNQVQHYKDELENKFLTLKSQMKEELKVLLTFKDVILQNLRRTMQESRSKLMIRKNKNLCQHLVDPHGKTNRVDAANMSDFAQVGHFSVHVMLGAKKSKLSKLNKWISESQAPMESKFIPEHPQAQRHQACGKEKTIENAELISLADFEEKLLPNSLRFANEYDWTRTQRRSRLYHSIAQKKRSNLQTERLNKALQKYMKWIIQHISSGRKRVDTICSKCGLAMRKTMQHLDSSWTIVVALLEKSKRECNLDQFKGTHMFHTSFGSNNSNRQGRSFDKSLRIGVDDWEAPQKLDHKRLKMPRGSSLPQNIGYEKSVSDFHLALCPQENEGKMRWLYSNSELEELRDLWNMDADYANPTTKQHQNHTQVQASREWIERANDNSFFQLTEDTNLKLTVTDTISCCETSSMSMERLGCPDMVELEDAVGMFRQSCESPHIDNKSMEQAFKIDFEHQRSNEVQKAQAIQDEVEKESKNLETELLHLCSQPWTLRMAPEMEEVEDRVPSFITLEFAIPREDEFTLQGMQVNRYQRLSARASEYQIKAFDISRGTAFPLYNKSVGSAVCFRRWYSFCKSTEMEVKSPESASGCMEKHNSVNT